MSDSERIAALWRPKKQGAKYVAQGTMIKVNFSVPAGASLVVVENRNKTSANAPDYHLLMGPPFESDEQNSGQGGFGESSGEQSKQDESQQQDDVPF